MRNPNSIRRTRKPSEEGYLLLAVMFLMALLVLSLAVAAPSIARSIQRDREVETMQRGKQYIRAIRLYYRKFHAYPPSIDALVKTNDIRFLRKRYIDPMTGKDDWKPIAFGQNKVPIAMGFFGQPLGGSSIAGVGPSGGNGLNGANGAPSSGGFFNSPGGSGFGSSPGAGPIAGSSSGLTASPSAGSTDNSANSAGSSSNGATGTGSNSNTNSGTGGIGAGPTGQTFGGAGVIGFSPASAKQSILIYKTKDHYNEWEFTYDPIMEMTTVSSGGNAGSLNAPGNTPGAVGIPGITAPGSGTTGSPAPSPGNQPPSSPISPPETPAPQP
jgi:type II secretory pathway pseudopilin PulG